MSISWSKLRSEIRATIEDASVGAVVVAVSGGVDSMFLLDFMRRHNLLTDKVDVVHFNHLPGQSMDDSAQRMVEKYCTQERIDLIVGRPLKKASTKGASFEAVARKQRYMWFRSHMRMRTDKHMVIITAHNLSDQVEGILMGICRGVPADCVAMAKKTRFSSGDVTIYRPLLAISKDIIYRQARRASLEGRWEEDVTNGDMKYERNFMRHAVIPMLMTRRNVLKSIPKSITIPEQLELRYASLFDSEVHHGTEQCSSQTVYSS